MQRRHRTGANSRVLKLGAVLLLVVLAIALVYGWRRQTAMQGRLIAAAKAYNDATMQKDLAERQKTLDALDKSPVNTLQKALASTGQARLATLGSSVTAGSGASQFGQTWVWRLYDTLHKSSGMDKLEYSNNGFGGYTTSRILAEGKADAVIQQKPTVVLLETCTLNDHGQNVPLATTLRNLDTLIEKLTQGVPGVRIIVQSPNPKTDSGPNALHLTYSDYLAAIKQHAEDRGWEYLDVFADFERQRNAAGLQLSAVLADGVHPNDTGYGYWATTLKKYFLDGKL